MAVTEAEILEWAARHLHDSQARGVEGWVAYAQRMRDEGRRICPDCDTWQTVTQSRELRVHRRLVDRWRREPCGGSRTRVRP